jgi:cell wall-associated NlpC family hydrolase
MQRKRLLLLTGACLFSALLYSCHTRKKAAATSSPQKQKTTTAGTHKNATGNTPKQPVKAPPYQLVKKVPITAAEVAEIKKRYAVLLRVKPTDLSDIYLYKFIDRWYGINYQYGGTKRTGIDCSAFAQKLYDEVYGVDLVRTAMDQFNKCQQVKQGYAKEGDLVFFHVQSKKITHVGIYLTNNYFVHASSSDGIAISNLNEDYWRKYYAGTGRIPKG